MLPKINRCAGQCLILGLVVLAYSVMFPHDLGMLLAPFVEASKSVLSVSQAISPWLYILTSVAILAWTFDHVWGRRASQAP